MPPPRTPILPSRSCSIAIELMFCEPLECCVQPSAYMLVMVLVGDEHSATICAIFRNLSFGVPEMRSTISGVYCLTCSLRRLRTQRGFCSVSSTLTKPSSPVSYVQVVLL